jgi:hypothetical protein
MLRSVEFSAQIQTLTYTGVKLLGCEEYKPVCGLEPFSVCHSPEIQTESGEQTSHKSSV